MGLVEFKKDYILYGYNDEGSNILENNTLRPQTRTLYCDIII